MIEKLKYLLAGSLMLAAAGAFVACDDDAAVDEWGATYVYMARPDLGVDLLEFNLTHSSLGIAGDTSFEIPVTVKLSKPLKADVEVVLGVSLPEGFPAEDVSFEKGGRLVIPAGETSADDKMVLSSDWSFADKAAATYNIAPTIESVVQASDALRISSNQRKIDVAVHKAQFADILNAQPDGTRIQDRSGWSVSLCAYETTDPAAFDTPTSTLTNNNTNDYVYFGTQSLCFRVDMGSEITLSGLESYCSFGASYCMSSCAIYSSTDGQVWTRVTADGGLSMALGASQCVKFIAPVTCRYFIWFMDAGSGRQVLSSEIYGYTK